MVTPAQKGVMTLPQTFATVIRRTLVVLLTAAVCLTVLSACIGEKKSPEKRINNPISAAPAPPGWVNSKDGAFRIKLPESYLDAYDAVSGQELPDAQVILSLPSSLALNGYVPVLVIDHAQATTDPDIVKKNLAQDEIYRDFTDFTVLNPTQVEGMNILEMTWRYRYQEVEMTAFLTMASGNNYAYALKQDIPDYALETYQPIIDVVLSSWTWNEAVAAGE